MREIIENVLIGITLISAIMVISVKNPVYSVLYLILVFINATGILITWGMDFLAMIILIVYVGAIAILFLFVVMMLNIKRVEILENQLRYLPIGGIVGIVFFLELMIIIGNELRAKEIKEPKLIKWEEIIEVHESIRKIGEIMYTEYVDSFLFAGWILLIGMIGAIMLTRKEQREVKKQSLYKQITRKPEETVEII